jgi:fimbrial isopeptide formation D2 family protein/LPXTG-motif cell wall-anchored protein
MSKGLTLDTSSVNLYVTSDLDNLGTAKTAPTATDVSAEDDYKGLLTGKYADGKVWKWSIADVKAAAVGATAGQYVVITYSATLNDDAIIGKAGNPNVMYVEYANNPNVDNPQPEGETTPEVNIVFTYQVVVDKVKGTDLTSLTGAGFTLYKQYAAAQTDKGANAAESLGKTNEYWYAVGQEQYSNGTLVTFNWQRIDDGNYILKETHTPTGYNTIADIPFTVTVTHSTTDTKDLTNEISVTGSGFQATTAGETLTFTKTIDSTQFTHTIEAASGTVAAAVENNQGAELPSTGGVGTTMFYIIGAILVLGAGILLVSKRRMSAN